MKKWCVCLLFLFLLVPINVKATDEVANIEEELFAEFDFTEIDQMLEDIFPGEKIGFLEMVTKLISGELDFSVEVIKEFAWNQLAFELSNSKSGLIHILLLVIVAAIFANFSSVFKSKQVSEIGFSMMYMFLLTVCLSNFHILVQSVAENLQKLMNFMEVLGPVYFLAVGMARGSMTSVAFYQLILVLIFLVELLILNFLLPAVKIYFIVKVIGEFSPEIPLSKFAEFLEMIVNWSLKTLTASIIGINVIQGLLMPAIDSVKRSVLLKSGEAIPMIGDLIGGSTEIVLGTAVLIKNGIGVVGMIICLIVCLPPLVQMGVTALMYQLVSAVAQPISDKRMVNCIGSVADGSKMLLKITATIGILFLLTIAVVASTTGG